MFRRFLALSFALISFGLPRAAQADEDNPFTTWQNTTPSNVTQSALITSTNGGVNIGIAINGQNEGTQLRWDPQVE